MAPDKSKEYPAYGNYKPIISTDVDGRFPVVVYESHATKVKVAIVQVEGPLVNGFLTVATEARDDDGLPHTLEHIIFMGSEDFPFKGVLDLLANRCLSSGTNAWTDIDHTCYTLNTAGSEGFCNLLPIFLDHVLYPTMTEEAFITEVHHVNGEGEDAGIVYSEMQASENSADNTLELTMKRAIYPGDCGYRYEHGGIMKNLRESTSNAKVRDYHKTFYRPENLWVIVTGQVDPLDILKSIEPIEKKMIKKGSLSTPYVRPWMEPLQPLTDSVDKDVPYPADEEDFGIVLVGWRGPSAVTEQKKLTAVSVLLDYLTDTAISPLQKAFVEIESPLASKVSSSISENSEAALSIRFSDVPLPKLTSISEKLWSVLREITVETLDMDRIRTILRRKILDSWATLESDPHQALAFDVIGFMLYGNSAEDLTYRLNEDKYLEELMTKDAEFWIRLLRDYLDEAKPHVVLRGKPSLELKAEIAKEEKNRFKSRQEELGPEGLAIKKKIVEKAIEANEEEPEDDVLTSVPIPSTDGIHFHPIRPYSNFMLPTGDENVKGNINSKAPHFDLSAIPIRMRVDDVNSNFVYIQLIIDTTNLDPALRLYLPLYLESITECPLKYPPGIRWAGKDGPGVTVDSYGYQIVPYEMVVAQIEVDTQSLTAYLGVGGGGVFSAGYFSNYAVFSVQVERGKYAEGIRWLRDILYFPHMDPARVQVIASKLAQSVAQKKRKGSKIVKALITDMDFMKGSNHWAVSMVRQQNVLNEISQNLSNLTSSDNAPEEASRVIANFRMLQKFFAESSTSHMLHMATSLERLHEKLGGTPLEKPWLDILLPNFETFGSIASNPADLTTPLAVVADASLVTQIPVRLGAGGDLADPKHACILGMGSVDSAYLLQTMPVEMKSYAHPDCAPLMLFLQYLQQLEGPIWRGVRGPGFSYHYYLKISPEEGLLTLCLGMSSQLVDAYGMTERIVREHVADDFELDDELFESAKSSLIFGLIEKEQSISDLVDQSLLSAFRGVPVDFSKTMIDRIWNVTEEEMVEAGKKYLTPLFDASKSRCAIVCHSDKLSDTASSFQLKFGRPLHAFDSVESSFLNQM